MIKAPCKSVSWSCEVLPAICLLLNCHQPPLTQQPDSLLADGGPRSIIIHRKLRAGKDRQLMNMSQAILSHTRLLVITSSLTVGTGALKKPKKQFSQIRRQPCTHFYHFRLPLSAT